jgi:K+-sensing histidine kinase KdpD
MPPPDLDDPAERAAYRAELRMVARPIRWMGVALAVAAMVLAILRAKLWPQIPEIVVLFLLGVAVLHMLAGIVVRMKYHQARMRR